ncbi:FAD-dependent oxidoreductase [Nonomuraea sp. KC401]|uniref:FAD-dependent oxidoreductase n=1 Tax=unclassified Nonomuraea TaxID=2593643 RepID=UPI0010FD78BB|nr:MULTISPECIES: FAD-dependent oxidoreductase [unclassified Nonomuraea]NBE95814.1 FAD-dependent oxidoreductase [Nonomuraea sp. K271]TLF71298.1 FAD-dependent oxidoreductase [Nonomuraea sp. KC401]
MRTTVAVVGGGYGGITVAKELDSVTDVVLIEPRDTFVHHVAALRGLTDAQWTDRLFLSYDRLLARGTVIRDRGVQVDETSVTLRSGTRIEADYIVLATGSAYPFPAKVDVEDSATAKNRYHATRKALAQADSVLLLGAGPVGLELAGEIKTAWPDKSVTIVDRGHEIVSGGYSDEFRAELRRQLDAMGIRVILGAHLREQPPSEPGEAGTFAATLHSGEQLTADIWFRCFGSGPDTGYLTGDLATARQSGGRLAVTDDLRLPGLQRVFALGDITAIQEPKQAGTAIGHAAVIAANIRALVEGNGALTVYRPGPPGIVLPLGPHGGATYAPDWQDHVDPATEAHIRQHAKERGDGLLAQDILDAEITSQLKGQHLNVDEYAQFLNVRSDGK